jgi:hypothetical protein
MNVGMLYFNPGSQIGNGIGVFNAWEKSKEHEEIHNLIKYLVYWVTVSKLIFISLLLVIIITGSLQTQLYSVVVLILSIFTFFWRLFPLMRHMDRENQITPNGYSKTLGIMIATFIFVFIAGLFVALI